MLVFLDSSIICADFYMRGTYFDLVKKIDTIVLSEIVIAEIKNKHKEMLEENIRNMKKVFFALDRLTANSIGIQKDDIIAKEQETYSDFIDMFLIESGMTIAESYPQIEHKQIVERALQRKKPFKTDGKNGYRDYLVWRTFLDMAKRYTMEEACFITMNTRDFSDERDNKKLHPDLISELDDMEIDKSRIHYWTSLKDYVEFVVKPRLKENEEIQKFNNSLLADEEKFSEPLKTMAFENLLGLDLSNYDVAVLGDNPTINTIDEVCCMEIEKTSIISDAEYLLEIHLDTICILESFLLKSELADIGENDMGDSQMMNSDWNEHFALLETQIGLKIDIEVIYNTEQKVFSTFELSNVSDYNCIYCPYD